MILVVRCKHGYEFDDAQARYKNESLISKLRRAKQLDKSVLLHDIFT